jgi:protein-L-isoaspartate(D-aspartate) O-methyltransferase
MMDFSAARAGLISHLSTEIRDKRVLAAMAKIPRELFVPVESRAQAYEDHPLPIGHSQTISQPYIIALMTQELELTGNEKVLEIGTGSGYQAAILAELSGTVHTVERIPALADTARKVLDDLGYKNVFIHLAEDTLGWQQEAPYDAIMVTAGAPGVPDALLAQLAAGGRMVIPVGSRFTQELCKIVKSEKGTRLYNLGGCRFVALIGSDAWEN